MTNILLELLLTFVTCQLVTGLARFEGMTMTTTATNTKTKKTRLGQAYLTALILRSPKQANNNNDDDDALRLSLSNKCDIKSLQIGFQFDPTGWISPTCCQVDDDVESHSVEFGYPLRRQQRQQQVKLELATNPKPSTALNFNISEAFQSKHDSPLGPFDCHCCR